MTSSVTRLLFKKGDRKDLKNWRPISLLNADYKICSKALANRVATVLPSILNIDQTCSVPGRTIYTNLSLLRDVLDYVSITQETGILLNLDQEKAFDRVDRAFLSNALAKFGFSPIFQQWVSTLYNGAQMKILVNGHQTEKVFLNRGVRQGDPLSPLLYVICAEVLACNIRDHPRITGFLLPGAKGAHFKISQYADDSTCYVKDHSSLQQLLHLLSRYEMATGAKLNFQKTEAMWLGAWRSKPDTPSGLTWVNKMKILGVWFSNGSVSVESDNWQPRLNKLENNLNLWKSRSLSLVGRSLIVNTLGASKFWFLAKILPIPPWVATAFKRLVYHFIWGTKIEPVSRKTLSAPIKDGGLGVIDFDTKGRALKLSLIALNIEHSHAKVFYTLKYFIGTQLSKLAGLWAHLRDNSSPRALMPTPFYTLVWNDLVSLSKRIDLNKSRLTSKSLYSTLLNETGASPPLLPMWRVFTGAAFDIANHWPLIRDDFTENYKNDIAWLIAVKGIKVRDSLRSWGYIASDVCAFCNRKETIAHCFINCKRAKRVWSLLVPTLSALLTTTFVVNVNTIFFFMWPSASAKADRLARFLIKSTLYQLWAFRNRTTFHGGTDDERAIVRSLNADISLRLRADHFRLSPQNFTRAWVTPTVCTVTNGQLEILLR